MLSGRGKNVRPRATKTVLGPRLLRSLRSSDSFGGTRADIFASVPRAAGWFYPIGERIRRLDAVMDRGLVPSNFQRSDVYEKSYLPPSLTHSLLSLDELVAGLEIMIRFCFCL